jgi:hypothetical protein
MIGGLFSMSKTRRAEAESAARRAAHPEAPWMWRTDWAAGRIEDSNRATMSLAWTFAGFWNLISLPAAFFAVRQALRDQEYGVLFVLLFPAVGLGLLAWAIRSTIRFRRFGVSRFEPAALPFPIGRSLRGTVVATGALDLREEFLVTLTCLRRVTTGSGKNRSTSERVLWQEERRASARQTRGAEGTTTSIPVAFDLPADGVPSDESNPRNRVIWRLAVSAEVPGVDYDSAFEVPVYRTAESETPRESAPSTDPAALEPFVQPQTSRVQVTRNRRGTEILFPAGRNPGASAGLTAFLALWLGIVWALVRFDAPLVFQLIFGAVGLLLTWATVSLWLGVSRVTVSDGTVVVASGLVAPLRERRIPAADISEVKAGIGMQAGNTPYYDLVLMRKDGKRISVGRGVRDKREAEWLAQTVRVALTE